MLPNDVAQIAKYTLEGIMYGDKKDLKTWIIENNFQGYKVTRSY